MMPWVVVKVRSVKRNPTERGWNFYQMEVKRRLLSSFAEMDWMGGQKFWGKRYSLPSSHLYKVAG